MFTEHSAVELRLIPRTFSTLHYLEIKHPPFNFLTEGAFMKRVRVFRGKMKPPILFEVVSNSLIPF